MPISVIRNGWRTRLVLRPSTPPLLILLAFEKAEPEPDSIERRRLLNFGRMARRETDRVGRVKVAAEWPVLRYPNIFVIGDAAQAFGLDSEPMPGVTAVAKQQRRYVAELLTVPWVRLDHGGNLIGGAVPPSSPIAQHLAATAKYNT
jgi:hypothetical protein